MSERCIACPYQGHSPPFIIHRIVPSVSKDYSSTTLAYTRHQFAGDAKVASSMLSI